MLYSTLFARGVVYKLVIQPNGALVLLNDSNLDNLLVILRKQEQPNMIAINDKINDVWGQQVSLKLPPPGAEGSDSVWFKFEAGKLELWTLEEATAFERFTAERMEAARFAHVSRAEPSKALLSGVGSLDSNLAKIESHLLMRRIDSLETRLDAARG